MRHKTVGAAVLIAVLILLLSTSLATVSARPPERWFFEDSGEDAGLVDCGDFVIDGEYTSWERGRNFFDKDGNWTGFSLNFHFDGRLTNRETGLTIHDEGRENVKYDAETDTLRDSGLVWSLNVPGHGVVALDAGTVLFDMSTDPPKLLHEGGPHQVLHGLDVIDVLCTYMAD